EVTAFCVHDSSGGRHGYGFVHVSRRQGKLSKSQVLIRAQDCLRSQKALESLMFYLQRIGARLNSGQGKSAVVICDCRARVAVLIIRYRNIRSRNDLAVWIDDRCRDCAGNGLSGERKAPNEEHKDTASEQSNSCQFVTKH